MAIVASASTHISQNLTSMHTVPLRVVHRLFGDPVEDYNVHSVCYIGSKMPASAKFVLMVHGQKLHRSQASFCSFKGNSGPREIDEHMSSRHVLNSISMPPAPSYSTALRKFLRDNFRQP